MSKYSILTLPNSTAQITQMFNYVAPKYDLVNKFLSLGMDSFWRKQTVSALNVSPGGLVLDLAAGTGASTSVLVKQGVYAVAVDVAKEMLLIGEKNLASKSIKFPFLVADGRKLPFRDACFDAVTCSFGIRNIQNISGALVELFRVTKPGGRLVICEFSHPINICIRKIYLKYFLRLLPKLAKPISKDQAAYVYLADTIKQWPNQLEFANIIAASGWSKVRWRNLTSGIVALHSAIK